MSNNDASIDGAQAPQLTTAQRVPATRDDLMARLEMLGMVTSTLDHPAVFTVAESSELEQRLSGGHTKNLFLKDDKGALYLVVAEASTRVDLKALGKRMKSGRLSFGKPELMGEVLGITPGSVTAFAVMNAEPGRIGVVIDAGLMRHDRLNCHPLVNTATTNIARDDLLRFIRVCGHEPRILEVTGAEPA